jgi:branched-chain amino acid transport system permease protein
MSAYLQGYLVMVGVLILLGWSLYLPLRAGYMNNSPIFFMAISGYFVAYTTQELHWAIPVAFAAAVAFCFILALLLSLTLVNVSGFAMAVATIALVFIIQTIIRNLEFLGAAAGFSIYSQMPYLLTVTYVLIVLNLIFLNRLANSRFGRALEAMEFDHDVCDALGINRRVLSIFAQTYSGTLGAVAGVLYTFNVGTLFPEMFGFNFVLYGFTMVLVGGRSTLWGVLIFGPVLWSIPEFAPPWIGQWRNIMFGGIIVLLLVLRPKGVITKETLRRLAPRSGSTPALGDQPGE